MKLNRSKKKAEYVAQQDTKSVCPEIKPLARACSGAVGLEQFHKTTQKYHTHNSQQEDFAPSDTTVTAQVFKPYNATRATIHSKVCPLVDELYIVKRCFREERGQRKHPDKQDAEH